MSTRSFAALAALSVAVLVAPSAGAADDKTPPAPPAWVYPQDMKCAGRRLTLHEPEVTNYDAATTRVTLRFPTTLTDPLGRSTFGISEVTGSLHVDFASKLAKLDTLAAGPAVFPGAVAADAAAVNEGYADALPKTVLFRLELLTGRVNSYKPDAAPPKFPETPPAILVRLRPAILVQIDGEPVLQDVETFPIQYVANTASDIFRDAKTDLWYLLVDGAWMQSKTLQGPWKKGDGTVPSIMSQIPGNHPRGHIRKHVPGTPEFLKRGPQPERKEFPEVIVTDKPSELVMLAGDPLFTLIPGVRLMIVANTESDLFFHPKSNLYYLLVGGRWFTAEDLDGAWKLVDALPEEFAKIPRDSIRGHVVWCVPGTPEAMEACATAALEERATVDKYTPVQVLFEGKEPAVQVMNESIKFITNSEDDCFGVAGAWYVCQRGLWYKSEDGRGKWAPAADLPAPLKALPEDSGSYQVNFCRPLGLEGDTATFSVKGGWYGTFAWKGAPVYGTGTTKRGVLRNGNWYPWPRTYGENRWFDPVSGVFQPRSVRVHADGTTADEWSPYTASYGRVVLYGSRYDQGGRRMFQFSENELKFDLSAGRPDVYSLWLGKVKKREGLDVSLFPFGDRSTETPPAEPRLAADASGNCWRMGAKGYEMYKAGWLPGKPGPEVIAELETLARIDARPAVLKKWREQRSAPIPVNAVVTLKTK